MGSCSSIHRNTDTTDMKLKLSFGSKTEKLVIHPSPIKEKTKNGSLRWSPSRSTTTFMDKGSKDEAFFDSKPWLDSDCDDFYSVNGDFTPSRGSTPVHHSFGTPVADITPSENRIHGSISESSPGKKKLLDLFKESITDNQDNDDDNGKKEEKGKATIQDVLPKSAQSTPYISGANSGCSSERIMSEGRVSIREKAVKSAQWCLPGLSSCRSFRERRRKTSPAIAVNGKY